ncbi:hypothetical protein FBU59_000849 [Linderina macrospora]|uniref:Uncharacterized protein n=1 Tax=Linderina macrospora TaxID=4868 RepID=A0ACC1JFH4_9FUNG|nr:hypothetical protein FBU59_000849 [Linderina macrospora]
MVGMSEPAKSLWRGRDVVFVDPLDNTAEYWWPAMIVPTDEIDASMGCRALSTAEYLVKYFEDNKYSTVREQELRVFDTAQEPFTEFAANTPGFMKDRAIKSALSYLKTGHVHAKFKWKLWQTGTETLQLPFALTPTKSSTEPSSPHAADSDSITLPAKHESPVPMDLPVLADDEVSNEVLVEIKRAFEELEEMQREFRACRTLVRNAARDVWEGTGNEWPPNSGASTRFGHNKRRKVH